MLFVIIGHSVDFWKGNWFLAITPAQNSTILCFISDFLNSFHIYAFTFASGYLFYYLKIEQLRYAEFFLFLKSKAKRLIIPYIFVCAVYVIPVAEYFFHYSISEIITRYVLGTSPNQLWFLLMLFWVYIIAWPLSDLFNKKPTVGMVIVGSLYLVGVLGSRLTPNYFFIWSSCEFVLFFWLGFMFKKLLPKLSRVKWYVWQICFIASFMLLEYVHAGMFHSLIEIVVHMLGAISAFETINMLSPILTLSEKPWFKAISQKTMPIYLFHQQIIYFCLVALNGKVSPLINAFINFGVSLIGSFIISSILMYWKHTRFLIGEK